MLNLLKTNTINKNSEHKEKNNDDDAKERQMLGCEPGVAAITREKGAADVTAWGAHRPDHRPHQDGDDDGLDQYKPGQEEKMGRIRDMEKIGWVS